MPAARLEPESDVARAVIGRLGVEVTTSTPRRLESFRATDVDACRRFLATEGESAAGLPPADSSPFPGDGPSSWLGPRAAGAEDAGGHSDVLVLLERLRTAIEARDVDILAGLYVDFPREQRTALERYFRDATNLRVRLEDVDVAIAGDEAIVSYTPTDDFVDVPTGRPMHVSGRVTKLLRRVAGGWRLAPGK